MLNYRLIVTGIHLSFTVVEAFAGRLLNRETSTRKDVVMEVASVAVIPLGIVPMTLFGAPKIVEWLRPGSENALVNWPWWLMFIVLLLADDLTQYWWHRLAHTFPQFYKLHRAHHSAQYMSVRIVYRNNIIFYALMPGLWLSAALIHLGFGSVYVWYICAKMLVIIGAHSSVPWDVPLLKWRATRPLMWVLERLISTPATHAAHHGRHEADGVTHYHGNYGNFLFLWDVIFGTAKVTRRRPDSYGLEDVGPASLWQELVWPFGKAATGKVNAELSSPNLE